MPQGLHHLKQSANSSVAISKQNLVLFLVTGAGIGYFPRLPGTAATLIAIPLSLALNRLTDVSLPLAVVVLVVAVACAIRLSTKGAAILGQKDPQIIVIDEIVGFLIANFTSAPNYLTLVLGFILFRFFDVAKIFPIAKLETLPGGTGIVLDDVMAGLYTLAIVHLITWWGLL
jgi:phosphatidylglycerophosphatase A